MRRKPSTDVGGYRPSPMAEIVSYARRFTDLGVTGEELATPEQVDVLPRRPQAAGSGPGEATGSMAAPAADEDLSAQVMPLRSAARRAWDATVDG